MTAQTAKRPLTAEDLYLLQIAFDPQISPDGTQIVFCVQRVDRASEKKFVSLWLVAADGSAAPRQITFGDQRDTRPRWSPDGRTIAFLSNRADEKQAQIYLLPVAGGEARPLSTMQGSFANIAWSPDGSRLLAQFRKKDAEAIAREQDEQARKLGVVARRITNLDYKSDGAGYLPQEKWHLWLIDAADGTAVQLTDGPYSEVEPAWSPDGTQIVFVSNRSDRPDQNPDAMELYSIAAAGGEMRRLASQPGIKIAPAFSPDGTQIAFLGRRRLRHIYQNFNLFVIPAEGGEAVDLSALHGLDVHLDTSTLVDTGSGAESSRPTWSRDGRLIYCQASEQGGQPILAIPTTAGIPVTRFLTDDGIVGSFTLDAAQQQMAFLWGTLRETGQIWVRDMAQEPARKLTEFNAGLLDEIAFGQITEAWVDSADGTPIHGWILTPPGFDPAQKTASILEIHGGPMSQYGRGFTHEFHLLAAQGYVVYWCNPRGSRGYGEAFAGAIYNNWGTVDYEDVTAWVDFIAAQPYIDTARMGVTGGSYGGYMTLTCIGRTDRFRAAVAQRVVSNLVSFYGSSDMNWSVERLVGMESFPWDDLNNYWRQSPMSRIGNATTPTLLIHSENDYRCPQEQAEQVFAALQRLGVDSELILFPEESHGLSRDGRTDRRIARLEHMLRWFKTYLT